MPDRFTSIIVLCEDLNHGNFIRKALMQRGVIAGRIRLNSCPRGRQAGSHYVLKKYPDEAEAVRSGSVHAGLIAVIDADTSSVVDRRNQMAKELVAKKLAERRPDQPIAILVPKRNIETWVCHLLQIITVNEEDDFKRHTEPKQCGRAGELFALQCPHQLKTGTPPSLVDGCCEFTRFMDLSNRS